MIFIACDASVKNKVSARGFVTFNTETSTVEATKPRISTVYSESYQAEYAAFLEALEEAATYDEPVNIYTDQLSIIEYIQTPLPAKYKRAITSEVKKSTKARYLEVEQKMKDALARNPGIQVFKVDSHANVSDSLPHILHLACDVHLGTAIGLSKKTLRKRPSFESCMGRLVALQEQVSLIEKIKQTVSNWFSPLAVYY